MNIEAFKKIREEVGDEEAFAALVQVDSTIGELAGDGYTPTQVLDLIIARPDILKPTTPAPRELPPSIDDMPPLEPGGPSGAQIAAGIAAEALISEGGRIAGTATGAKLGGMITAATGGTGSVTIPVTTAGGYLVGSLVSGAGGSIVAQKIEGADNINYGRVVHDSILNTVPGLGEAKSGPKAFRAMTRAMAQNRVKTMAGIGAISGATGTAATNLYDRGEVGSAEELFLGSAMGATLGGTLGYTSKTGANILRKLAGKPVQELNRAVYGGDMDAVSFIDIVTKDVDPDKFLRAQDAKAYLADMNMFVKSRMAPSKVVGQKATQFMRDAKNQTMAGRETGGILGERIDRKIRESADPEVTSQLVAEFVTGKTKALPPELKDLQTDLSEARKFIHEYQTELLDLHYKGEKPLTDLQRQAIEQSVTDGSYLTRTYRFFDDPTWRPSPEMRAKAKAELVADGMDAGDAEKYLSDLNAKRASNDEDILSTVYSSDPRILKQKKDIQPALREYLGEYVSPGEKITSTMSALSRYTAYSKADGEITRALQDTGLLKPASEAKPDGWGPIKLRTGPAKIIDGDELHGPPELQRAINELYAAKAGDAAADTATKTATDWWETGIALSKAAKVLGNPPAYMVQFYGNLSHLLGMWMNPFKGAKAGMKAAIGQMADSMVGKQGPLAKLGLDMSIKDLNEFKRMKELGMVPSGLQFADIQAGLKKGIVGEKASKLVEPFGKVYSVFDTAMRVVAFKNYEGFLAKAAPTAPADKMQKAAANLTNNTYPNYDYINSSLKTLSRKGVPLSQFASFTLEMMRTQYNQGQLARRMIFSPEKLAKEMADDLGVPVDKRVVQMEGVKRAAALATVYVGTAIGISQFNRKGGVTEEEEQAYRRTVFPEWDKNRPLLIRKRDDGQIESINASYLVPHMQMAAPALAALRGESFEESAKMAMSALQEDLSGEGSFMMNAFSQALNNSSYKTKQAISVQPDGLAKNKEIGEWFIKELITPGISREIEKARVNPPEQTVLRQMGIRINNTTVEDGFRFKTRELKEAINMAQKEIGYARNKMERGEFTPEDFARKYQNANSAYKANMARLIMHVKDLRTLGKSEDEIFKMMREYGVGSERAIEAYDGWVDDLPAYRPPSTADRYDEIVSKVGKKNVTREFYEVRRENPELAQALVDHHKRILRDEKLNVSEREKTLRALDASDGTRANFIFREMKRYPERAAILKREYMRKGIINQSVYRQLRVMEEAAGMNAARPANGQQPYTLDSFAPTR